MNEVQNAEKARFLLRDLKFLHIPKNVTDLCTKRILVMEYMPGIQVNEKEKLEKHVSLLLSTRLTYLKWNLSSRTILKIKLSC